MNKAWPCRPSIGVPVEARRRRSELYFSLLSLFFPLHFGAKKWRDAVSIDRFIGAVAPSATGEPSQASVLSRAVSVLSKDHSFLSPRGIYG